MTTSKSSLTQRKAMNKTATGDSERAAKLYGALSTKPAAGLQHKKATQQATTAKPVPAKGTHATQGREPSKAGPAKPGPAPNPRPLFPREVVPARATQAK